MAFVQSELIEVRKVPGKGRGVFARAVIRKGTVIERVPVIVVQVSELCGQEARPVLADYAFTWSKDRVALALGYGSLYNHSYHPNARYYPDGSRAQIFAALRKIAPGEEITVNYNGDADLRGRVGFTVV